MHNSLSPEILSQMKPTKSEKRTMFFHSQLSIIIHIVDKRYSLIRLLLVLACLSPLRLTLSPQVKKSTELRGTVVDVKWPSVRIVPFTQEKIFVPMSVQTLATRSI